MSTSTYLVQRLVYTIVTLIALSLTIFIIIQLPPGDAVDRIVAQRRAMGDYVDEAEEAALRSQYGLDRPLPVQYWNWLVDFLHGDMGQSLQGIPVLKLVKERLAATLFLSISSLFLTYAIAIPIGIYSATHQYSLGDYFWTALGFIGLATPNFLLALILIFLFSKYFGLSIGGLFSPGMQEEPWSLAKVVDLINHLWVPLIVIATAGTAGTIRVMRATLLDELGKQYVTTARAKGVPWRKLLFKYPVRIAINPIVSTIGRILPLLIAGQTIVAIVLNLPTLGPLLYNSLRSQDIELAASVLMIQSVLAILGVILSDILLVSIDPRIRFEKGA